MKLFSNNVTLASTIITMVMLVMMAGVAHANPQPITPVPGHYAFEGTDRDGAPMSGTLDFFGPPLNGMVMEFSPGAPDPTWHDLDPEDGLYYCQLGIYPAGNGWYRITYFRWTLFDDGTFIIEMVTVPAGGGPPDMVPYCPSPVTVASGNYRPA